MPVALRVMARSCEIGEVQGSLWMIVPTGVWLLCIWRTERVSYR